MHPQLITYYEKFYHILHTLHGKWSLYQVKGAFYLWTWHTSWVFYVINLESLLKDFLYKENFKLCLHGFLPLSTKTCLLSHFYPKKVQNPIQIYSLLSKVIGRKYLRSVFVNDYVVLELNWAIQTWNGKLNLSDL